MYKHRKDPVHESVHVLLVQIIGGNRALEALLQRQSIGESELLDRFVRLKFRLEHILTKGIVRMISEKFILRLSSRINFG